MRISCLVLAAVVCSTEGCQSSGSDGSGTSFQRADLLLGQADFTSASKDAGESAASLGGVQLPTGDAVAFKAGLVLPDTYNNRLLLYQAMPTRSGTPADVVLGQPDPASESASHLPGRFHYPRSAAVGGEALLVADAGASRVVLDPGGRNVALGWDPSSPTYRVGCAADRLDQPARAIVVAGKLIVADRANNRVLIWNTVPTGTSPADVVVGQKDLVHCAANDMVGNGRSGGKGPSTLYEPSDVWSDGKRLLVVDQGNNRVLLWNTFPSSNAAKADVVLGQPDFLAAIADSSSTGLDSPGAVASDGNSIFVADVRNNRVLGWRRFPSANAAPADLVLGQGDFVHNTANDDGQTGIEGGPTARTMNHPMGVALVGGYLIVTDTYNNRFLLFRGFAMGRAP